MKRRKSSAYEVEKGRDRFPVVPWLKPSSVPYSTAIRTWRYFCLESRISLFRIILCVIICFIIIASFYMLWPKYDRDGYCLKLNLNKLIH